MQLTFSEPAGQVRVEPGGAAYDTEMSPCATPAVLPATSPQPRKVQPGVLMSSTGLFSLHCHGPLTGSSWLTEATRDASRAALATGLKVSTARPPSVNPKARSVMVGTTNANSTRTGP